MSKPTDLKDRLFQAEGKRKLLADMRRSAKGEKGEAKALGQAERRSQAEIDRAASEWLAHAGFSWNGKKR